MIIFYGDAYICEEGGLMKQASYWSHEEQGGSVVCRLCPNFCRIGESETGICRVRRNIGGVLFAEGYGKVSSMNIDPVEKKPLYHYLPGTDIFSIGGWGCNFRCLFCQNWSISQEFHDQGDTLSPEHIVKAAETHGTPSIAYTYNEPLIGLEFVVDCAHLARERGIRNVAVTNGYISKEAGADAIEAIDAFNVDIKSIDAGFYRRNCGGALEPVLDFCRAVMDAGRHIEITNLVIPGENDGGAEVERLAEWVAANLGRHVPLHLSAYRPMYKMSNPATDEQILKTAFKLAGSHLDYVYLGNLGALEGSKTMCPDCYTIVIERNGYRVSLNNIKDGSCSQCGKLLSGFVWPA